jgi:hypothetical protein
VARCSYIYLLVAAFVIAPGDMPELVRGDAVEVGVLDAIGEPG